MIKAKKEIVEAVCDGCGKNLFVEMTPGHKNANYGELVPSFGYGSPLDPMGGQINPRYALCEECFAKAANAVGLPVHDMDPVICPVCRKPRNGEKDHPECMRTWIGNPDSEPNREMEKEMERRRDERP